MLYEHTKEAKLKASIERYKKEINELEAENKRFRQRELDGADLQAKLDDVKVWIHECTESLDDLKTFIK